MKKCLDMFYDEYVNAVKRHGKATREGDYKIANKQYNIVNKVFKRAHNNLDSAYKFYGRLMDHEDASVIIWACAHSLALRVNIEKAESKLTELSKNKNLGILRFGAEMTLKVWKEQGYLKF